MKISAVKIYNIRSFLDIDNYLAIEDAKTAIIGINESGKSNILEAIGNLDFANKMGNYYTSIKNLSVPEPEVKILIELSMNQNEMQEFHLQGDMDKTMLTFAVGQPTAISGALQMVLEQNEVVKQAIEFWNNHNLTEFYVITSDNRGAYYNVIQLINNSSSEILELSKLDLLTKNFKKDVDYTACVECVTKLKEELLKIYMMFPVILYKQWNGVSQIKAVYTNADAQKELTDKNSSLYKLVQAAEIEINDMKKAFELPEGNERNTLRYKIEQKIQKNVCIEFKRFYKKSELTLLFKFEGNKFFVNVLTGDMVMSIGERSNGLRWYLGLFVELMAMDYKNRDVLYLLDEPGVFLHVNAQKELLSLFDELCENGGQVVYTTHLPYMLDTDNIYCIRRVEKDDNGQSHIFNRVYSGGLELPSRQETLTPLIQAMGCDMKYLPDISHRNNIITEGITDRMYLEAGITLLNITESVNFIPSNGAAAIPNIVSIMIGWGCDYKIVLDYDKEGFTQYKRLIKHFGEEITEKIVFVASGEVPEDVNDRIVEAKTIESLLSINDMHKLDTPYDGTDNTKIVSAVEFRSKVLSGELEVDEETNENYCRLFKQLGVF